MLGVLLEAVGVTWEAGGRRIVDGVDIAVEGGELVGVIGPNGAGKTTLLRLLTGLLAPAAGEVRLAGRQLASLSARDRARRVSYMSQDTVSSFAFTVMEVLLMARYPWLGRFDRETAEDREQAVRMLSYVGLAGLGDLPYPALSGGERQLVQFARVLVQDTDVIALDEPSANLDIRHQDRVFSMARELAREGRAVVASVHDLDAASRWCSRLVLLDRGRLAAAGTPAEVLTSERLDGVYGVRTIVTANPVAGGLAVSVAPERLAGSGTRVHLIGGAGGAVNLTRELLRLGCEVSGGIAHEHDSDEKLWRSLGIEHRSIGAFDRIGDSDVESAAPLAQSADVTVLCSFPIGPGNLGNLRLAARARRLVVLEPGPGDVPRSFFSEEARKVFAELSQHADIRSYERFVDGLKSPASPAGPPPLGRRRRRA